ncbi:hypothetical protein KKB44_00615 [Candidatus Micrarchaeota archaeon]|nr:hypothetical protein [Candidatus Micrarchaeota archaeon]
MRELKLRRLAKPLKEARCNPKVDTAAVFVERLFGRPMQSNADLILVSDENRETYLRCVDEDFPRRSIVFSPLSFLLDDRQTLHTAPEGAELFGFEDLLRPIRTYRRYTKLTAETSARCSLMEVGRPADQLHGVFMKWTHPAYGLYIYEYDLVVSPSHDVGTLVHELIHAEDRVLLGIPRTLLDHALTEGRASFGGELFRTSPEDHPSYRLQLDSLIFVIKGLIQKGPEVFQKIARDKGIPFAVKDFVRFLGSLKENSVEKTSVHYQLLYLPYAIMLLELSQIIGDPYAAFQISTEKHPSSWRHIFSGRNFYANEFSTQ